MYLVSSLPEFSLDIPVTAYSCQQLAKNMICRQVTVIIGHPIRMKAPITAVHYLYYMLKVWVCTLILLTLLMPQKTSMRYAPYSDK